ncbi:scavenger receptor class B member 1 [Vespula maculifrons]|uniref:Scavenger receptor class B member 1 n=1 Tax=Vespula maculifrons TaxID=7453 RepID=A0ABD2CCA8_VESMC
MRFITSLFGDGSPKTMGRQYMKVGRNALLGIKSNQKDGICSEKVPTPLSMLISRGGKLKHIIELDVITVADYVCQSAITTGRAKMFINSNENRELRQK